METSVAFFRFEFPFLIFLYLVPQVNKLFGVHYLTPSSEANMICGGHMSRGTTIDSSEFERQIVNNNTIAPSYSESLLLRSSSSFMEQHNNSGRQLMAPSRSSSTRRFSTAGIPVSISRSSLQNGRIVYYVSPIDDANNENVPRRMTDPRNQSSEESSRVEDESTTQRTDDNGRIEERLPTDVRSDPTLSARTNPDIRISEEGSPLTEVRTFRREVRATIELPPSHQEVRINKDGPQRRSEEGPSSGVRTTTVSRVVPPPPSYDEALRHCRPLFQPLRRSATDRDIQRRLPLVFVNQSFYRDATLNIEENETETMQTSL